MPKLEALYYPSFEPPSMWLRSFLLFFDKIRTIVPNDVDFIPSKDISEIINFIPDAFETIHPKNIYNINIDKLEINRWRIAFDIIKKNEFAKYQQISIYNSRGRSRVHIAGYTFLHREKIPPKIFSLLKEFGLIKGFDERLVTRPKFYKVNENASNLIVSEMADRIAKQYGWNTVTDRQIDFAVNSLNAFQYNIKEPRNTLVSSIISCEIPQEIQYLNPKQYNQIRENYSDIREPFQRVINDLSNLYRLETIEDGQTLQKRITEIINEFSSEVEKFKKSNFGRTVKHWMPIGIGSLASLIGAAIAQPIVSITSASVGVVIQVLQESNNIKEPESEQSKVYRLIAGMQKDILKKSEISRLIYENPHAPKKKHESHQID